MKKLLAWLMIWFVFANSIPGVSVGKIWAEETEEEIAKSFIHPGMLHTAEAFEAMRKNVEQQLEPNYGAWLALRGNGFSDPNWNPRPLERVERGSGTLSNVAQMYIDIRRAYQTALVYQISGDTRYGDAAVRILNAWSSTMTSLWGNADRFLAAGIYGYELANAAEIMRDYPGFDKEAMDKLLLEVFLPLNQNFLENHNDAHICNYWANWDLCNIASVVAIGIFTDRRDIYEYGINYYKTGRGNGSLYNAMPFVFENGTAQWQESCRDQGHTVFGLGLCSVICEMAWNQGDDLYGLSDNRLLKAAEYVSRYNDWDDSLDFADQLYVQGQGKGKEYWYYGISGLSRGHNRSVYHLIYNHYVNRRGLSAPHLKVMLIDHGKLEYECGNGDELGWQSLTFANLSQRTDRPEITGDIANGSYRIVSELSHKAITVNENGKLAQAEKGTSDKDVWHLVHVGGNEYKLINRATGTCMQAGNPYQRYTEITLGEDNGSIYQRFAFVKNATGDYHIVVSASGYVVELADANTNDDAWLDQFTFTWHACQGWTLELVEEDSSDVIEKPTILRPTEQEKLTYEQALKKAESVDWYQYTTDSYEKYEEILQQTKSTSVDMNNAKAIQSATQKLQQAESVLQTQAEDKKGLIAHFTFDGEETGLAGANAVANPNGTIEFVEDEERGKVLSLDGSTAYLTVTRKDNTPILGRTKELTISYYSKVARSETNWGFYGARDGNAAVFGQEMYIGCLEQNGAATVERYQNGRQETASGNLRNGWNHIVAVFGSENTKLYVNGKLVSTADNHGSLTEILGRNSIFQIGRANWGEGEYYQGLLDEFKIYNWAFTDNDVEQLVQGKEPVREDGKKDEADKGGTTTNGKTETNKERIPTLTIKKATLGVKEKLTLKIKNRPAGSKVTYKSTKPSVAKVSKSGKITAKKVGKATIKVKVGKYLLKCKVTVKKAPKKINLNARLKKIAKGKTFKIKVKLPKKTASYKISYKSNRKSVATVNQKGLVKAKKKGTATITVKTFNKKKATIKIQVK